MSSLESSGCGLSIACQSICNEYGSGFKLIRRKIAGKRREKRIGRIVLSIAWWRAASASTQRPARLCGGEPTEAFLKKILPMEAGVELTERFAIPAKAQVFFSCGTRSEGRKGSPRTPDLRETFRKWQRK